MTRSRTPSTPPAGGRRLDDLAAIVWREAEGTEADPFDDAMLAAVAGLAEVLKAEAGALAEIEARLEELARRAAVSE